MPLNVILAFTKKFRSRKRGVPSIADPTTSSQLTLASNNVLNRQTPTTTSAPLPIHPSTTTFSTYLSGNYPPNHHVPVEANIHLPLPVAASFRRSPVGSLTPTREVVSFDEEERRRLYWQLAKLVIGFIVISGIFAIILLVPKIGPPPCPHTKAVC